MVAAFAPRTGTDGAVVSSRTSVHSLSLAFTACSTCSFRRTREGRRMSSRRCSRRCRSRGWWRRAGRRGSWYGSWPPCCSLYSTPPRRSASEIEPIFKSHLACKSRIPTLMTRLPPLSPPLSSLFLSLESLLFSRLTTSVFHLHLPRPHPHRLPPPKSHHARLLLRSRPCDWCLWIPRHGRHSRVPGAGIPCSRHRSVAGEGTGLGEEAQQVQGTDRVGCEFSLANQSSNGS